MIDRDFLERERESLAKQQASALALYHQAGGCLQLIDAMLEKISNDDALEQVKDMTGADSAEIVKMEPKDD